MPWPAPVTIAIFPSSSPIKMSFVSRNPVQAHTELCTPAQDLASWSGFGVAVAELELHDLAGGVPRQRVDELEVLGQLLLHQPALEQVGAQLVERGRIGGRGRAPDGPRPL